MQRRAAAVLTLMLVSTFALAGCQPGGPFPAARLDPAPTLPQAEGTYLNMGRNLLASNQVELAHDAFIRSIQIEGPTAAALTGAGLAAERQGLLRDARRFFERARLLDPNSVMVHNNLGATLYRLGEYHEARQAFQAAFALSSCRSQVAEHNLGLSELAIRRQENRDLAVAANPFSVQRLGSGVYTLKKPGTVEHEG